MSTLPSPKNVGTVTAPSGWIRLIRPLMDPPSLKDNRADADRLIRGIKRALQTDNIVLEFSLIKKIPSLLRRFEFDALCAVYQEGPSWHLIALLPGRPEPEIYGISVDLGSSMVVARLLNLTSGETTDEVSFLNPQNAIGPDILTRIHFAAEDGGLEKLQTRLLDGLNREISQMAERHGIDVDVIVGMTVAGNTTMTHLFLGLDPFWLCREPYIPVVNRPGCLRASDLNLVINPQSPVLVSPNVGSYFGGDLITGILASGMNLSDEVSILVDVGTNAEVVLGNREWLMACAGAAGPALEGGVANMGMMAGPGVIDRVAIDPQSGEFHIRTIDNRDPVGICGSGLIDLVAQLFMAGMIDLRGKYVAGKCGDRLLEMDGISHLIVVNAPDSAHGNPLTLSQPDIDSLLRSKAAMYTILVTITGMINISMNDISRFLISGTFGSYIDTRSAITLGMIPDLPVERYRPLGNSSLTGATRVLLSAADRDEIYKIRDRITYIELNVNQEFMNRFSAAKFIPHTDITLFPSVRKWRNS